MQCMYRVLECVRSVRGCVWAAFRSWCASGFAYSTGLALGQRGRGGEVEGCRCSCVVSVPKLSMNGGQDSLLSYVC